MGSAHEHPSQAGIWAGKLIALRRFLELIRFSHTVFALPFSLLACAMAFAVPTSSGQMWRLSGPELWQRLVGVVICMVTARSAAMAFNRLVDAEIDRRNPRTANRHLPAGLLTRTQVWGFFFVCSTAFIGATLLFLPNWLPLLLSPLVLLWVCGYSFTKRFTQAAHWWLGVALALAPVSTWIAVRGEVVMESPADLLPTATLAIAIALWVAGFDIIYACQDAEFDARHGLFSIPGRLGIAAALRVARWCHVLMLIVLAVWPWAFPVLGLGGLYWLAFATVTVLVVRQHLLVREDDLQLVGIAFFHLNALISLGFCSVTAIDLWV